MELGTFLGVIVIGGCWDEMMGSTSFFYDFMGVV